MFDEKKIQQLKDKETAWREETLKPFLEKRKIDPQRFPKQFYSPLDVTEVDFGIEVGFPGEYPFTTGTYPMAEPPLEGLTDRARYSGYGTPEDTRDHFKYLISHGFKGLSLAFDLPPATLSL